MEIAEKYLWVEKYRPKNLDELVLNEEYKNAFAQFIETKEVGNLLLHGVQGSGKTTVARILIDNIITDKFDRLILNGSNDTGVDVVRERIVDFLSVPVYGDSKQKIVFIDEFDYMTPNAQAALRAIIEEYSDYGRFILTANYISKVIDPLKSRMQIFEFKELRPKFILDRMKFILEQEEVEYNEKDLVSIISAYHPDIRRIIGYVQSRSVNKKLRSGNDKNAVTPEDKVLDLVEMLPDRISSGESVSSLIEDIQKSLSEDYLEYQLLYKKMFMSTKIPAVVKIIVNDFCVKHNDSMIPEMNFMACVYEMCRAISERKKKLG